jgi:hypothetical protein
MAMSRTDASLDQGSTFLWTQAYGDAEAQGRRRSLIEDLFFAVLVTAFLATSLGMMSQNRPVLSVESNLVGLPF